MAKSYRNSCCGDIWFRVISCSAVEECGDVSVGGVGACLAADLSLFVSAVQGRRRRRSPGRGVQRRSVHAESLVRFRRNFRLFF